MTGVPPRQRRAVATAVGVAVTVSVLWTGFLVAHGLADGRLLPRGAVTSAVVLAVYLAAAVIVLRNRPVDPVNRATFAFLVLLGTVNASRAAEAFAAGGARVDRLAFAASSLLYIVLLFWVGLTVHGYFPVRRLARPGRDYALATAAALVPASAYLWSWWKAGAAGPPGRAWSLGLSVAALVVDLFVFVYFLTLSFAARREDVRRRARVVFVAVAVYMGLYLVLRDIPALSGSPPLVPGFALSLVSTLFPASLIVAVTRYRLFEVDRLIRRGAAYASAAALLVLVLVAGVPVVTALLVRLSPALSAVPVTALVSVVLFLLLDPFRRRTQAALARRLARGAIDPRTLVADIVAGLKDVGEEILPADVMQRVSRALHPSRQAFWVFAGERDGTPVHPVTAGPLVSYPDLDRAALLPHAEPPEERRAVWFLAPEGGEGPRARGDLAEKLRGQGFVLAFPLFSTSGEPVGLIALGAKKSGDPYVPEEVSLLVAVAEHAALALERFALSRRAEEDRRVRDEVLGRLTEEGGGALYECELCGRVASEDEIVCGADGHAIRMTQPVPRLLAGRYRLDRRLGEGGMGAVYVARDVPAFRDVAVKLIRAEQLRDKGTAARFRREARLTARLAHPNAVAVYDYGELPGGGAFLVMELLQGGSLRTELSERGPLPYPEVAWVLDRALDVLAAAHAAGLVHRDVKPDNLYVTRGPDGARLKLLDFGLARETRRPTPASGPAITSSETLLGTPGYMAPELLRGADASPASDQWAIAFTAVELLTGVRLGIEKLEVETHRLMDEVVAVVTTACPDAGVPWARVLARALAADPDDRWVSVVSLRRALARFYGERLPADRDVRFVVLER